MFGVCACVHVYAHQGDEIEASRGTSRPFGFWEHLHVPRDFEPKPRGPFHGEVERVWRVQYIRRLHHKLVRCQLLPAPIHLLGLRV